MLHGLFYFALLFSALNEEWHDKGIYLAAGTFTELEQPLLDMSGSGSRIPNGLMMIGNEGYQAWEPRWKAKN